MKQEVACKIATEMGDSTWTELRSDLDKHGVCATVCKVHIWNAGESDPASGLFVDFGHSTDAQPSIHCSLDETGGIRVVFEAGVRVQACVIWRNGRWDVEQQGPSVVTAESGTQCDD